MLSEEVPEMKTSHGEEPVAFEGPQQSIYTQEFNDALLRLQQQNHQKPAFDPRIKIKRVFS